MMKEFLHGIINGTSIEPPDICKEGFTANFEGALKTEWYKKEDHFEAIFYRNNIEHIAVFELSGAMLEYKMFLPLLYLPEAIKKQIEQKREIMNVVLINKGNSICYEVISRDKSHQRYLSMISDLGEEISIRKL